VSANPSVGPEPVFPRLASRRVVFVLTVAAALAMIASVPLKALAGAGFPAVVMLPFAVFGALIARRQPGNPIGGLLLLLALSVAVCADAGNYSTAVYQDGYHLPLGRVAVFFAPGAWTFFVVFLALPLALFPDGRLSLGWRRLLAGYLVFAVLFTGNAFWQNSSGLLAHHIQVNHDGELQSNSSPAFAASAYKALLYVYLVFGLAWVARLLLAYRRSSGDYRQQLKWLLSAGAFAVTGVGVEFFLSNTNSPTLHVIGNIGLGVSLTAFPIAFGVGILKYRLYEIDRLISRTISYLIITGLLVGVFISIVVLATDVLPFSSPVAVAASTLAAAALFNPLRLRVQRLVDRRFNRARYDAEAIVAAFNMRLRDAVDLDTIRGELLLAVDRAVEPAHASVWIRPSVRRARV
jgi:MFS family permease